MTERLNMLGIAKGSILELPCYADTAGVLDWSV